MSDQTLEEALEHIESLKAKNYEAHRMLEETKKMMYERSDAIARVRELARKLEQEQPYVEMAVYAFVANLITQALDGEQ